MGQDPKEKTTMTDAANLIMAKPPVWDEQGGSIDHYYWYYATYAMYQMGGNYWTDWSRKINTAVVKNQRLDGNFTGSWDPVGVWGDDGGRGRRAEQHLRVRRGNQRRWRRRVRGRREHRG